MNGFELGLWALGLAAAGAVGFGVVKVVRFLTGGRKKKAPRLPKHQVPWSDEKAYEEMLARLHAEVRQAVLEQDLETLEVIASGSALALFRSRFNQADHREVLQGSVRQSLQSDRLVVVLAVTRWGPGWRRHYEEWTMERRGNGWFIVGARPTKLNL